MTMDVLDFFDNEMFINNDNDTLYHENDLMNNYVMSDDNFLRLETDSTPLQTDMNSQIQAHVNVKIDPLTSLLLRDSNMDSSTLSHENTEISGESGSAQDTNDLKHPEMPNKRVPLRKTKSNPFYSPSNQTKNLVQKNKIRFKLNKSYSTEIHTPLSERDVNVGMQVKKQETKIWCYK